MALSIIFMGTPEFSVPALKALRDAGHDIAAVYCQPPRAGGRRGLEIVKSPVHRCAEDLDLPVRHPASLRDDQAQVAFAALNADLAVVVAYGLLLPRAVLDAPKFGCINAHASLLPRWRGAAPIQRAIMAGDRQTGICIMQMDAGLDTGPVGLSRKTEIGPDETAGELHDRLAGISAKLLVEAVQKIEAGTFRVSAQEPAGVTYARKIDKSDTRIDWSRPATEVGNQVRGLAPAPGAWCEMPVGGKVQRVKILSVAVEPGRSAAGEVLDDRLLIACGKGAVRLNRLQRAGGRALDQREFLAGNPVPVSSRIN